MFIQRTGNGPNLHLPCQEKKNDGSSVEVSLYACIFLKTAIVILVLLDQE